MEARLIINKDEAEEVLQETSAGWRGTRTWLVNTSNTTKAMRADGLPELGDPWSDDMPDLKVVRRGPTRSKGGWDDEVSGRVGTIYVPVEYETPRLSGRFTPASEADVWTEVSVQVDTLRRQYPVERLSPGGGEITPILNGDGIDTQGLSIFLNVHSFWRADRDIPWDIMLRLGYPECKTNDRPVTVPNIMHSGRSRVFDVGQLLFLGPQSMEQVGEFLEIVWNIRAAANFEFLWQSEDDKGNAAQQYRDRIYERDSFAGLWIGA